MTINILSVVDKQLNKSADLIFSNVRKSESIKNYDIEKNNYRKHQTVVQYMYSVI